MPGLGLGLGLGVWLGSGLGLGFWLGFWLGLGLGLGLGFGWRKAKARVLVGVRVRVRVERGVPASLPLGRLAADTQHEATRAELLPKGPDDGGADQLAPRLEQTHLRGMA